MSVRALVLDAPGELSVRDVPEPEPGTRALVAVERVGICGTDLKVYSGALPVDYPRVLGHEMVGRVVRPGPAERVRAGGRVVVDPAVACGACTVCRADRAHLCPQGALMGRDVDGGCVDLLAVPEERLVAVPDSLPVAAAGLVQVLGVCVHAQTLVQVFPGQTAAVVGLGVGGLLHVQLLRARGVTDVIGITRSAAKRALAERLGATVTCPPEDAEECARAVTGGRGVDLAVECVGTTATLAQSIRLVGPGCTVLLYGSITEASGALPFYRLYENEISIVSSRAARWRDYARAAELVDQGVVQVLPLLSGDYPLESASRAFGAAGAGGDVVKLMLRLG